MRENRGFAARREPRPPFFNRLLAFCANRFDGELGMGRELFEQFERPFIFAPARNLELLELLLPHAGGHGGELSLDGLEAIDCGM